MSPSSRTPISCGGYSSTTLTSDSSLPFLDSSGTISVCENAALWDLMQCATERDPNKRVTVAEAKRHSFYTATSSVQSAN